MVSLCYCAGPVIIDGFSVLWFISQGYVRDKKLGTFPLFARCCCGISVSMRYWWKISPRVFSFFPFFRFRKFCPCTLPLMNTKPEFHPPWSAPWWIEDIIRPSQCTLWMTRLICIRSHCRSLLLRCHWNLSPYLNISILISWRWFNDMGWVRVIYLCCRGIISGRAETEQSWFSLNRQQGSELSE